MHGIIFWTDSTELQRSLRRLVLTVVRPELRRSTDNLLLTVAVFKPPPKPRRRKLAHCVCREHTNCIGGVELQKR
jgi:hypothetical protein